MAAMRARAQPAIGSAQWINDENAQVSLFCGQEAEDFAFSARNEVDWLNEHMAEILSNTEMNVADAFKTPGKLRGKTPRTARKRDPLEAREPLTDLFSTNARSKPLTISQTSPTKSLRPTDPTAFKVAKDPSVEKAIPARKQPSAADSGYHGLPEDEMEIDQGARSSSGTHDTLDNFPHSPTHRSAADASLTENSATERSFHSAKEDLTKKDINGELAAAQQIELPDTRGPKTVQLDTVAREDERMEIDEERSQPTGDVLQDESRPSSPEASPVHGLVRKSSLTFASLPAREPITTKKSIGNRTSRTSQLEQYKSSNMQNSLLGRLTGGKSLGGWKQPDMEDKPKIDEAQHQRPPLLRDESDSDSRIMKLHNKSSTQRLHERINLLGKSQPPRPTKSIPSVATSVHPAYPDLSRQVNQKPVIEVAGSAELAKDDEDDDWILPPQHSQPAQSRPPLTKSISADVVDRLQVKEGAYDHLPNEQARRRAKDKPALESQPTISKADEAAAAMPVQSSEANDETTTPVGSPDRRYVDGHLSASKSKLQSIMQTARGLFSSSANASAQAKMDVTSPSVAARESDMPRDVGTSDDAAVKADERSQGEQTSSSNTAATTEPRKTRSSTEKEARVKQHADMQQEQVEREKEKVRQQEAAIQTNSQARPKAKELVSHAAKSTRQSPRKTQQRETVADGDALARSIGPNSDEQSRQSQVHKLKDVRRPVKPAKDAAPQQKAPPVNIRIGMPSRRVPLNNAAISSNLSDSLPPPQSKQPGLVKKTSSASIQSSALGNSSKTSGPAAKPKALIAAERKKEQDEREAQRKLEQKREIERRRAAQQEETRRHEQNQRQEAEKQKEKDPAAALEDSRKQAQRQAIEKRRLEMQKKDHRPGPKAPNDQHHNSNTTGATNRAELGGNRPPSRQANTHEQYRSNANHQSTNQPKAAIKRVFDPENDNAPARNAKSQNGQSYQQQDSKRRRTEEDEPEEFPMRPTKAPPIRQSGVRNGPKASIFSQNYTTAPPPAAHNASSLVRSATTNQAYQQHVYQNQPARPGYSADTSKYQDGNKIPFAENPNPPYHRPTGQSQPFKTPLPTKLAQPTRQSPQYPNGEHIQLQDIPTDSEDSDSSPDTAQKRQRTASLPEWVQSPYLNNLLRNQEEYMDPDAVFGPVGSPHLEEMFRERAHKFRSRTSSANWAGQDRLTQDEIRKDVEARARIRKEGGWTYGGAT